MRELSELRDTMRKHVLNKRRAMKGWKVPAIIFGKEGNFVLI